MIRKLRVRVVTAALLAALLMAAAASPIVSELTGSSAPAYADECVGSSC